MNIEQVKTINSRQYKVARLSFFQMRRVLGLMSGWVGTSLFKAMSGGFLDAMLTEVLGSLVALIGNLDSDQAKQSLDAMARQSFILNGEGQWGALVSDRSNNLDLWFQQYPEDFFPYLSFAIEVNFRDFFSGAASELNGLIGRLPEGTKEAGATLKGLASQFLMTSIGLSGGSSGQAGEPAEKFSPTGTG